MGLYSTLFFLGALVLSALMAVWLFYKRSHGDGFPEEIWDPYLKEEAIKGDEEISKPTDKLDNPSRDYGPFPVRPVGLEENLLAVSGKEEQNKLGGSAVFEEADRQVDLIGGVVQSLSQLEHSDESSSFLMASEQSAKDGQVSDESPESLQRTPWWEKVVAPKDIPCRREVAELMGVAVVDSLPCQENSEEPSLSEQNFLEPFFESREKTDVPTGFGLSGKAADVTASGSQAPSGEEGPEVDLFKAEETDGNEPPPASLYEIEIGIHEEAPLESGESTGKEAGQPFAVEELFGSVTHGELNFSKEENFPGAEVVGAESVALPEPVFMPDEPCAGLEFLDGLVPAAESPTEDLKDKKEENSFTLESQTLEDEGGAELTVTCRLDSEIDQSQSDFAPSSAGLFQEDASVPEAEMPSPPKVKPSFEEVPGSEDNDSRIFEVAEDLSIHFGEKDERHSSIDLEKISQKNSAVPESMDQNDFEDSEKVPMPFEEEEGTRPEGGPGEAVAGPPAMPDDLAEKFFSSTEAEELPSALVESDEAMDVFSVIEQERSDSPVNLSHEVTGDSVLFGDEDNKEGVSMELDEPGADPPIPSAETPVEPGLTPCVAGRGEHLTRKEEEGELSLAEEPDLDVLLLSGESISEMLRSFVSECCPLNLLLIENKDKNLPDGIKKISTAGRDDIHGRLLGRTAVDSEEFLRIGILDYMMGRYDEALKYFKEALRRATQMGPVLNALGVVSYGRGKIDPAIAYLKEAVREAGMDMALLAAANRNIAILYQMKGEFGQAAQSTVSTIQCLGSNENPHVLAGLHMRAGQLFRRLGETENARHHLSESAHLFLRAGDDAARIRSLVALSGAQTELSDFDSALDNLDQAALLCRSGGDKAGEALVMGQMGVAYSAQDQYTRALENYGKAILLNRELKDRKGEGANLSNVGNIHYFRGDLEEAILAYEDALSINREQNHLIGQATILGNLGRIFLEQNRADEATERLSESLEIFRSAGAREQTEYILDLMAKRDQI